MEEITLDRAYMVMTNVAKTEALKGAILKHAKGTLSRIESAGLLNKDIRKIVLDEFNDLARETEELMRS